MLTRGWAIPTATDIAIVWFVARSVFGAAHPAVRYLLLLAIVDDLVGIASVLESFGHSVRPVVDFGLFFFGFANAGVTLGDIMFVIRDVGRAANIELWLAVIGMAVPGTAIAFVLWLDLLRRARLNTLNAFSFLTPAFALGLGWTFYDERLGFTEILGTCLVLLGSAVARGAGRTGQRVPSS